MSNKTQMPVLHREAAVVTGSLDEKARTFDIVWTAGAEVPRIDWWTGQRYIEVLEVSEKAIRLDRLLSGRAPVLDTHQRWALDNVMGNITKGSAKVDGSTARATVRLSNREGLAGIVGDVRDGIIANVSPGYITHAYREEMKDDKLYRVATDWEPIEISFVPVGADPEAGLARGMEGGKLLDARGRELPTYPCTIDRASLAEALAAGEAVAARMRMRARSFGH